MVNPLPFGLSAAIQDDLRQVFARFPEIRQVLIFGSRAKGNFRDGSDIDLAILSSAMSPARFTELWNELDGLPLLFKLDVLHWDKLDNPALKDRILAEGRLFYAPAEETEASLHD